MNISYASRALSFSFEDVGDGWLMCQRKGSASLPITASTQSASSESRKIGVSVLEDDIRYDLLASNSDMYY
ncbi:MAG: hypothetical protein PUC18_03185 [Prevotellaceae bacterium]|nr:hypothetical protein [Prevotellaceae bacterium]